MFTLHSNFHPSIHNRILNIQNSSKAAQCDCENENKFTKRWPLESIVYEDFYEILIKTWSQNRSWTTLEDFCWIIKQEKPRKLYAKSNNHNRILCSVGFDSFNSFICLQHKYLLKFVAISREIKTDLQLHMKS